MSNTTAQSKYELINDWVLPVAGDGLHSFVSLCNFDTKFLPLFELKVTPLRQVYTKYVHQKIPHMAWSKDLVYLFEYLKKDLTTEPVLARYDSTKSIFLKTDWSSLGMSFILMQPGNDVESDEDSICDFDVSHNGPRFRPISSGMRKCTDSESHYHSFVGEIATLRWAIAKNKLYLWGITFYVLCDMKSTYRILEYDGPIHSLRRWCQELQSYQFIAFHRPAAMMSDVDALNRGPYHRISSTYYAMVSTIREYDIHYNSKAYDSGVYDNMLSSGKLNLKRISPWVPSPTHSLRAALLLTTITEHINDPSCKLFALLRSKLMSYTNVESTKLTQCKLAAVAAIYKPASGIMQADSPTMQCSKSLNRDLPTHVSTVQCSITSDAVDNPSASETNVVTHNNSAVQCSTNLNTSLPINNSTVQCSNSAVQCSTNLNQILPINNGTVQCSTTSGAVVDSSTSETIVVADNDVQYSSTLLGHESFRGEDGNNTLLYSSPASCIKPSGPSLAVGKSTLLGHESFRGEDGNNTLLYSSPASCIKPSGPSLAVGKSPWRTGNTSNIRQVRFNDSFPHPLDKQQFGKVSVSDILHLKQSSYQSHFASNNNNVIAKTLVDSNTLRYEQCPTFGKSTGHSCCPNNTVTASTFDDHSRNSTCNDHAIDQGVIQSSNRCDRISCLAFNVTSLSSRSSSSTTLMFDRVRILYNQQNRQRPLLIENLSTSITAPSVNTFLRKHIVNWLSFNPGISTFGLSLSNYLGDRLCLTILESNKLCRTINGMLLPNAKIVEGDWTVLASLFKLRSSVDPMAPYGCNDKSSNSTMPELSTISELNGADFCFEDELELPLHDKLPPSVQRLVTAIDGSDSLSLQFFMASWPISHDSFSLTDKSILQVSTQLRH